MERPLLGGQSSNSKYNRRSDAITYGSAYERAAALIDLIEDGVGLPEEIIEKSNFQTRTKLYFFYTRFDILWTLNYFALVAINFLEKPLWCGKYSEHSCNERDYYFLGELPYLSGVESLIYEGITFLLLLVHILFPIVYQGSHIFWKRPIHKLQVILLITLAADILVFVLYPSPLAFSSLPFRIAPYIRVMFLILYIRELQGTFCVLVSMLPSYLTVWGLTLVFLLFSSWIAYVMFEDTKEGAEVFTSYGSTLYEMFGLFTISNNPDVWIPAYKVSRWYSLFFVLYILLGVYFVTNLILSVVYESFKTELAKQVSNMDKKKKCRLRKAFKLIDQNDLRYLNKDQFFRLIDELNKYRRLPNISKYDWELIFYELDGSGDFKINEEIFCDLCHAIALNFPKEDCPSCFEYIPSIYYSPFSKCLKSFIRSKTFANIVALVLVMNLIAVISETTLDIADNSAQQSWQIVEYVFGWIYVLEMGLKIYAYGFVNYWRDGQYRFDFIITCVVVIGETTMFLAPNGQSFLSNGEWIRYLILARLLSLMRLLMRVKRYRAFVATFFTLIPSLMPYLGTVFCVMCIYSSLAVQIFGGIVNAGNALLEGTDLAKRDYFLFNFNDYPNAMVTTFNLVVMGNWNALMQTYCALTGTSWPLVYFISFYLITLMLIFKVIIAFVLEVFFSKIKLEKSKEPEAGQDTASRQRRYYTLSSHKSRSQRVDKLLHRMLEKQLEMSEPCEVERG